MSQKIIQIKCKGAGIASLDELKEFQGELKSLSKDDEVKLRNEILTLGFSFCFDVWIEPQTNIKYILNGHQRKVVLTALRNDGYEIPPLPISFVYADSYKQAKRKLLAAASQYGKVEHQGLFDFITDSQIALDEIQESLKFPEIDFDTLKNLQANIDDIDIANANQSADHLDKTAQDFIAEHGKSAQAKISLWMFIDFSQYPTEFQVLKEKYSIANREFPIEEFLKLSGLK